MKPELQEALLSIIKKIDMGINWSTDQIPSAVVELLYYAITHNAIGLVVWGILFYIGIRMVITIKKKFGDAESYQTRDLSGYDICHWIVCAVLVVCGFLGALDSLYYLVKAIFFPQAWIVGTLMSMIK